MLVVAADMVGIGEIIICNPRMFTCNRMVITEIFKLSRFPCPQNFGGPFAAILKVYDGHYLQMCEGPSITTNN